MFPLLLLISITLSRVAADHNTISLVQDSANGYDASHAVKAVHKHAFRFSPGSLQSNIEPEELIGGFWYGLFDVGSTKNVSLLIDTGSSDVFLNPALYTPSAESENLNKTEVETYITTQTNGCGNATITANVFTDTVSAAGLTSQNQTFGSVIKKKKPNSGTVTKFPRQGIVGMTGVAGNYTLNKSVPWFRNLCDQKQVKQCRFGLAFGTSGKGRQILGGVDRSLFDGTLVHPAEAPYDTQYASAVVNDTHTVISNRSMIFDSGTANIVAPIKDTQRIFEALGIQAVEQHLPGCATVLLGYYPCDKPPQLGLQMVQAKRSDTSPVFNVEPSAFKLTDNGNNNCTAVLVGTDVGVPGDPFWIVGQAWYQGKYVSQDAVGRTLGVATLKDKTGESY